jgi:hypothetical protein
MPGVDLREQEDRNQLGRWTGPRVYRGMLWPATHLFESASRSGEALCGAKGSVDPLIPADWKICQACRAEASRMRAVVA